MPAEGKWLYAIVIDGNLEVWTITDDPARLDEEFADARDIYGDRAKRVRFPAPDPEKVEEV